MLIGLGHRSGHGKDTFAVMVQEILGPDKCQIIPFASRLKEVSCILYGHLGLREEAYYNTEEGRIARNRPLPEINLTPVEIWVKVGESIRNGVWHPTWLSLVKKSAKDKIIISPDMRHFNEAEVCDLRIKVINPRIPNREGASIDDNLEDYSGWDYFIYNGDGLDRLRLKAEIFVKEFKLATVKN